MKCCKMIYNYFLKFYIFSDIQKNPMQILILFIALVFVGLSKKQPANAYRVMGGTYLKEYPANETIPVADLGTLIDVNHTRMLTLPFYDAVYEQEQRMAAFERIKLTYGQDFTNAVYNPFTKAFMLPNGVGIAPYSILPMPLPSGYKTIQFDTLHPQRGNKWALAEAGWIMYSFTNGVYGGLREGFNRFAGDIIVFTDYIYLSPDGDWHRAKNREIIKGFTINPGHQIVNNEGSSNTLSQVEVIYKDDNNNDKVGRFVDATFRNKGLNGNYVHTASALWTWIEN